MPGIFMSSGSRASFQVVWCESYLLSRTPNGVISLCSIITFAAQLL
jgi:hypothetical protein